MMPPRFAPEFAKGFAFRRGRLPMACETAKSGESRELCKGIYNNNIYLSFLRFAVSHTHLTLFPFPSILTSPYPARTRVRKTRSNTTNPFLEGEDR